MRWPWEKREAPFTDSVVREIINAAAGQTPSVHATGALEAAAGLYSSCFAGADLSPDIPALTPGIRALMARDLLRRGESIFRIVVSGGKLALRPAGSWDVRGGPDPESWWYRLDEFGPSGNLTYFLPAAAVIHARYSTDPARPWLGVGPLSWASSTAGLLAGLETRFAGEASGPSGYVLPMPEPAAPSGDDDNKITPAHLLADLAKSNGATTMVETMAAGMGEGKSGAPMADWKSQRYGVDVPEASANLRDAAALAVLQACQVPGALFDDADGTSQREAWRRFAMGPLAGLAAIVEAEVRAKLMMPCKFDFMGLWAHDLAGRAASFQKMVAGGMEAGKAAGLARLMND